MGYEQAETPQKGDCVDMHLVEFEFLKGHIAATMALIYGLIEQGCVDQKALDKYFTQFVAALPRNRQTLALRVVIDQWRQNLKIEEDLSEEGASQHKTPVLRLIQGGLSEKR